MDLDCLGYDEKADLHEPAKIKHYKGEKSNELIHDNERPRPFD